MASGPNSSAATESGPAPLLAKTEVGARCDRSERLGALGVSLNEDRTIVAGAISDGVLPSSVPEVAAESGSCQLLVPRNLFCSSCNMDQACAGNDECVPEPKKVSAGKVTVEGLQVPVEVSPSGITLDYSKTVLEPFPAFGPGDAIELHAAGDVVPAFTAGLLGVAELVTDQQEIAFGYGDPAVIQWDTTNADPESTGVFVSFSVNVHGAVTGWIECIAPDTGEFAIPAELVSELIDMGLSGFPRAEIERRSSATLDLDSGCVEFHISSKVTLEIALEGLDSCNEDAACDSGQSCNDEKVCE